MSIFGMMDAANVPSDPYFIEKGDYEAEVTKAEFRTKKDNEEQRQLFIEYTITDTSSAYNKQRVAQYFNLVDPSMTAEEFALLPGDEKQKIQRSMSNLKRTLCGNESNSRQKGLGVPADDLNDASWNPTVLVGTKVIVNVQNRGDNSQYTNVGWVNLLD